MNSIETLEKRWKCGICGKIYLNRDSADYCCKPGKCRVCGVELKHTFCLCSGCKKKEHFDKLKLIEYTGQVCCDDNEHYMLDEEDFGYYYLDLTISEILQGIFFPEFTEVCEEEKWDGIDIDRVLEWATDDLSVNDDPDYITDHIEDFLELKEYVKQWNAKQNIKWYESNNKEKIRTISALKESSYWEGIIDILQNNLNKPIVAESYKYIQDQLKALREDVYCE